VTYPIADLLRDYLARERITQGQLAVMLGVNPSQVSNWLNGRARPSHANAVEIARVLGLPLRDVLEAAGYKAPDDLPNPTVPPWLTEILVQLDREQLRIVGQLAKGLLRMTAAMRAAEDPGQYDQDTPPAS
jgi:transcriptional regulator with XRE-family HTH domain